ncbi:MAG: helix-turn-helix transcriptional regulator [Armatimonadetes bacterium]|nr:helix-turn-helix transcriptional regulator [Armatimonadota bacterium]
MKPPLVCNRLKRYRRERGLSQKDVARALGLSSSSIVSRWENGTCLPDTTNALRLAALYRSCVDVIYDELRSDLADEIVGCETAICGTDTARDA